MSFQDVALDVLIEPAPVERAGNRDLPILSMTMHEGLVDQGAKFKKRVASANTSNYKLVRRNQLVVGFPIDEGVLSFQSLFDEAMVSPAYGTWRLRTNVGVEPAYLERFLRSPRALAFYRAKLRGTTARRRALPKDVFLRLSVPIVPLPEQRRVSAILDKTDALRAKRREALAQLDTLLQSTFLEMFGDPVTNPMEWRVGRLEECFSKTRAGTCCGPFGSALKKREYVEDGIPVWGIDNVKPNQFLQEQSLFITSEKFAQLRRYSVESGDILISRAGTVGRMCVAVPTVEPSIIGSNLIRLTLDSDAMLPVYFASLYTFCGERLPGLRASGDDKAYSFLNTTRLKSLVVPLPPLDLQIRFASIVESIDQQRACQRSHLAELDTLFASLQSRAFRGEL